MKKLTIRFAAVLLTVFTMAQTVSAARLLVPVGQVIGLELRDESVCIEDFDPTLGSAAREAGLEVGDRIVSIDNTPIRCAQDVRKALSASQGQVTVLVLRNNRSLTLTVTPAITEDGPKLGVALRQGVCGVGTVTYYDPDSGDFGALGHAVNQKDGRLIDLGEGFAYPAAVDRVVKGKSGAPGQLTGAVTLAEKAAARLKPGEDKRKAFNRIASMLARRGYTWDIAKQAIQQVFADEL